MTARCVGLALLTSVLSLSACNGDQATRAVPSAPSPLPSPPASNFTYWTADGTVTAVTETGGACSVNHPIGKTLDNWRWRITITSEAILLEQDDDGLSYTPFAGTLSDRQFTATYTTGTDNPQPLCQFKKATLAGSFSEGFSSFEAVETVVYASPAGETTVQWRWIGRCLHVSGC